MQAFKQVVPVVVLAALFIALPKGYAEPRDGWNLESRVPASSLGLISLEDIDKWQERFEKTAIAGLAREPEMKAFFEPIQARWKEMLESEDEGPFGEASALVKGAIEQVSGLRGQVAVAVLDVDLDSGMPSAVASLDFGPNVADFSKFVERMRTELDPDGGMFKTFEKDGRTWWQHQEEPPITATTVDTAFVIATDATVLESVIAGPGDAALGTSGDFATVRGRAGGEDLALFVYANAPAIVDVFATQMDEEATNISKALGLDTVKACAYGMAFRGDGFMDSVIVHAPDADHGIVKMISMPPLQPQALAFVPANAFYYEEGSCNWSDILFNIRELAGSIDPDVAREISEGVQKISDEVGVDIEKEILGGLAGGAATYLSMPDTGGLYPELAMMLQVRDAAGFEKTFQRLARGIAGMVSEEGDVIASTRVLEYRGRHLHLFEMQSARGRDVIPFTPTWTMMGDWLVITLVPHAMKEFVLRTEGTATGGGLAAQEDFKSLQAVRPRAAGGMSYLDLQAVLNLLYDTGVPILQTAVKPNVIGKEVPFPLDWAQLPATRTVRPYLRSLAAFTTWNKDGISIQMHGPLPLIGIMAVAGAIAVPALMLSVDRAGVRAPSRVELRPVPGSAQQRMAMLTGTRISNFVRAFLLTKKRLPADLQELVKTNTMPDVPKDPWGKDFELRVLDAKTHRFQIISAGPDGKFGTSDDVKVGR